MTYQELDNAIDFLENFEVNYKDRRRIAEQVMLLVERTIINYNESRPIELNIEAKKEVARRILELIQEDIELDN